MYNYQGDPMLVSKVKKWGNSLGVLIPRRTAQEMGIRPDDTLIIRIEKKQNPLKELSGAFPDLKLTKKELQDIRHDFESRYL